MKKINKLVLNKAKEMTAPEMKHIIGGRDDCRIGVSCEGWYCGNETSINWCMELFREYWGYSPIYCNCI